MQMVKGEGEMEHRDECSKEKHSARFEFGDPPNEIGVEVEEVKGRRIDSRLYYDLLLPSRFRIRNRPNLPRALELPLRPFHRLLPVHRHQRRRSPPLQLSRRLHQYPRPLLAPARALPKTLSNHPERSKLLSSFLSVIFFVLHSSR
jgi:hypothetical protein